MNKMSEQEELEFRIEQYNEFYRSGEPRISDQEYDQLIEELKAKFPDSLLLKKGVIEQKVSRKQKLPLKMYSLNKLKTVEEIRSWLLSNKIPMEELLVLTPKYDGISLVVNESNKSAWTRGDGEFGQESKWHFQKINRSIDAGNWDSGIKDDLSPLYSFGEAIMSKKNFEKYKGEFANPRNMVAGLFNRDITTMPLQDVDYICYGCDLDKDKVTQIDMLNHTLNKIQVPRLIIKVKEFFELDIETIEDALTIQYKQWGEDYQIDGLVIDINSADLRNKLGMEENLNPKYARAIKFPKWSSSVEVKVTGITWQVSKQGKLKPVIQIEPTELGGVTIENVTGYNAKYIIDNEIAESSVIEIVRSGDVIPKHISTLSHVPKNLEDLMDEMMCCPSCGTQTIWDETMTELICQNMDCKEKQISKLTHFFSTVEVEEFGEPSIRRFFEAGYKTIDSILNLGVKEMMEIEGFGKKSAQGLFNQFEKLYLNGIPLAKTIAALDVMEGKLGEKTIQSIFDHLTDEEIFSIIDRNDEQLYSKIVNISGVAEITAKAFIKGMVDFNFRWLPYLPITTTYTFTPKKEVVGDKYKGEKICFTGCRPSKELEDKIISQGGELVSGVSSKTTMLVVKDLGSGSSKMVKAKELGIKIVELKELS